MYKQAVQQVTCNTSWPSSMWPDKLKYKTDELDSLMREASRSSQSVFRDEYAQAQSMVVMDIHGTTRTVYIGYDPAFTKPSTPPDTDAELLAFIEYQEAKMRLLEKIRWDSLEKRILDRFPESRYYQPHKAR